jgi:putative transposase
MIPSYQDRLKPTYDQRCRMTRWLDMLRYQYNYLLTDRFDWWEMNHCSINACPLVSSIAKPREKPTYYGQKRSLVQLKEERPWYKEVHTHVLQDVVKRVNLAFQRWLKGDGNGERSGKPRFKGKNRYRTMAFSSMPSDPVNGNRVKFPKLGEIKFIRHRPLPEGVKVKRALITKKADGWYVTLTLEDKSIPDSATLDIKTTQDNNLGIDSGWECFVAGSDGSTKEPRRFYRQAEDKLAKLQVNRDKKAEGFKPRRKLNQRIAKLHQKIARQRKQWHYELAGELLDRADVLFVEDLQGSNMTGRGQPKQDENGNYLPNRLSARSGLNKSFADARIAEFLNEILFYQAEKAGKPVIKVNPKGTSRHCSNCLNRVPKELSDRWHNSCPHCGIELQRDVNSGILIKKVGWGIASLKNANPSKGRRSQQRTA